MSRVQEKTLVLLKPDALQRGLIGEILHRFERKGLKIVGMKMLHLSDVMLDEHYSHLKEKSFFGDIKDFMKAAPVVAMVFEGVDAVAVVRTMMGPTSSREAAPGTIRGDFSVSKSANIIHGSDSIENGVLEVERFFNKEELFEYDRLGVEFLYSKDELS